MRYFFSTKMIFISFICSAIFLSMQVRAENQSLDATDIYQLTKIKNEACKAAHSEKPGLTMDYSECMASAPNYDLAITNPGRLYESMVNNTCNRFSHWLSTPTYPDRSSVPSSCLEVVGAGIEKYFGDKAARGTLAEKKEEEIKMLHLEIDSLKQIVNELQKKRNQ